MKRNHIREFTDDQLEQNVKNCREKNCIKFAEVFVVYEREWGEPWVPYCRAHAEEIVKNKTRPWR